jgi:hypothetical protein
MKNLLCTLSLLWVLSNSLTHIRNFSCSHDQDHVHSTYICWFPHWKLRKACHPSNKSSNKSDSLSKFLNKKDVGYAKEERNETRACSKAWFGLMLVKRPPIREDLKVLLYQSQEADNTFITPDHRTTLRGNGQWSATIARITTKTHTTTLATKRGSSESCAMRNSSGGPNHRQD